MHDKSGTGSPPKPPPPPPDDGHDLMEYSNSTRRLLLPEEPHLPPQSEYLPLDLLLEVVARSDDVATILRCAAACKPLREAMLGAGFRPRSRVGLLAAVHAGYDPALLLGVSYASIDDDHGGGDIDDDIVRASWRLRFDTGQLRSFELVSSREGLLVLWRHEADAAPELRVCNTFTGHVACLPYMDEEVGKWGNAGIYRPALLSVGDDAGRSFELLAMDGCFRTCIFSYKDSAGGWGAIRLAKLPQELSGWCFVNESMHTSPAIVGRNVCWICRSARRHIGVFILAVHADAAEASAIGPPRGYLGDIESCTLATTADGKKLSMFIPDAEVIWMWTLSMEGWSCDEVISKQGISKQVMPGMDANRTICWFVGFGKRSRTVVFWMERVGLIEMDLGTEETIVHDTSGAVRACFHEIDMASLL